jgi:hypothetical protein
MPAAEEEQYQNFKDQVFMKVGRYRFFEDANKYPDDAWYYDYYPWPRPNLQFNWLLSLLNSQANARALKENSKLHPFRYALLASLTCQDELAEMIPPAITAGFQKSYRDIHEEVKKSIEASYAEREKRQLLLLHSLGSRASLAERDTQFPRKEMEYAAATSRLRYVMEIAGVPFPKWSMEFGSRNYVFFAGPVGQVGELGLFLWQELLDPAADHEIYQIYLDAWQNRRLGEMKFWYGTEDLCNALRQKSLKALDAKDLSRIRN